MISLRREISRNLGFDRLRPPYITGEKAFQRKGDEEVGASTSLPSVRQAASLSRFPQRAHCQRLRQAGSLSDDVTPQLCDFDLRVGHLVV